MLVDPSDGGDWCVYDVLKKVARFHKIIIFPQPEKVQKIFFVNTIRKYHCLFAFKVHHNKLHSRSQISANLSSDRLFQILSMQLAWKGVATVFHELGQHKNNTFGNETPLLHYVLFPFCTSLCIFVQLHDSLIINLRVVKFICPCSYNFPWFHRKGNFEPPSIVFSVLRYCPYISAITIFVMK